MADTSLNSILQNLDKSVSSISTLTTELLANPLATIEDLQKAIANLGLQEQASIDLGYNISDLQTYNTQVNESVTQVTGQDVTATIAENQQGIPVDLLGICKQDNFQGVRFYDGIGYGYLRILPDKVELLVGENYEYEIDTSVSHVYRITGKDKDIKLYIDGELVIDASGNHTLRTDKKLLEFGAISAREQSSVAAWQNFKYSVSGDFEPNNNSDQVLAEIMSFPEGGISAIKSYNGKLYVAYEPDDPSDSGCVYRFEEGYSPENRATLALTKSNVTCVVVDPNRSGNLFGSSGKFIGTDRGIQYIIGSKPYPWDYVTDMNKVPQESGWTLFENCTGNCYSLFDRVLTIDTREEQNQSLLKFSQLDNSFWDKNGSNALGWSVEVRVKITNDDASLDRTDAFNTPTDYVFILDNSSSAGNGNVRKYRDYLFETFLSSLNVGDNFAVIGFNDAQQTFQSSFAQAIGENIASARTFVQNFELPFGGALVENAFNVAFGLTYVNTKKKIIFIGSGQMTDPSVTDVSSNIKTINAAGPQATIYSISLGNQVFNTTGGSNKKKAYREIAEFNSGKYYQIQDVDAIEQRASEIWLAIDPDYFDWLKNTTPRAYALDPRAAFVQNADKSCLPGIPPVTVDADTPPPEDGINAPAVLINDGVFEEIVQFFERGIRLKYAKTFARIDLASAFTTIRIIGKDRSIAVFAKADNELQFKQVLYAPNSLFVRASKEGNQENPCLAIDNYGITHAAWSDSKNGNWNIYYSKKLARNISTSGKANTISQQAISFVSNPPDSDTPTSTEKIQDEIDIAVLSILNARIAFGLSPSSISNIKTNSIVSANGNFMSAGVQTGDTVVLTNLMNDNGERIIGVRNEYIVASVPDEAILVLDTTEDLNSVFNSADFYVYRGTPSWTTPVLASNQPMDSTYPFILTHSSGDVYIAYENNSAGASDIYVRRGQSGTSSTSFIEVARITHGTGLHRKPRMAELSGGKILLVWENNRLDLTKSQIYYVIIDPKSFGSVACYDLKSLTPDSTKAKNPVIASCGGKIATVAYEDTTNLETGKTDVFVAVWNYDNYQVTIKQISIGDGNNYNPSVSACGNKIKMVWENNASGFKEIMFAEGFCSAYSVMSTTTDFSNTGFAATQLHQMETGFKATSYGNQFGFTDFEANGGYSHTYFPDLFGLNAIDLDTSNRIMTLAIKEYEVGISGIGKADKNAGAILITGHDADYHGVTPNSGPKSFVQKAISYVTKGKSNPRLLYVTNVQNPGGDEIFGAQTLTLLGCNYDIADAFGSGPFTFTGSSWYSYATLSKTALDLRSVNFASYDAIVVASDYGAWLRQEEVDVLIARRFDLIDFINNGGGLLAFSEGGNRETQPPFPWRPDQYPAYPGVTRNRFGFLPFIETEIKLEDAVVVGQVAFNKVIQRITNSRGDSTNPSISCNPNGDIYIAYENDRVRRGIPKVYLSYYNPRTNEWISSNKTGLDTRVDIPLPEVSKPQVIFDNTGKSILIVQSLDQNNKSIIASVDIDKLSAGSSGNQKSTTLFGPNATSIAAAIESGHNGSYVASNAFDGNLTTYWASDLAGSSVVNSSIGQHFSENKEIARVQYYAYGNRFNNTSAIKVQFSDDGIVWIDAIAYTNLPTSGNAWIYLDVPRVGDHAYWRITPTEGTYTGYHWNILELQMMPYVNPAQQNAQQDNPVVAYFPLEDNFENSKQVINRIRIDGGFTVDGVSSENTNLLSVNSPLSGVSWFNPDSEKAFDLNVNGRVFSADSSYIMKTGAIDLWMTPHWASTDTTERIIFGNDDIGATNTNKISLGITPIAGGSSLKLRIVDRSGIVRETSVENNISETNYTWASGESVHLRSTWDEAAIGLSSINAISFASSTLGLAVGSNGVIFRTTDGGVTWIRIVSGLTYDLYSIDFLPDGLTAFVSGELGSVMLSSDGGLTWQINTNDFTEDLKSIIFNSVTNSLYVVGTSGFIAKSIDNGLTWTESFSNTSMDLNSIGIMSNGSSQAIIAVGKFGTIIVSTDDGDTFDVVTTKFNIDFYSVSRTHQATSYATYITGDEGTILKTSDLGTSWVDCSLIWTLGYQPKVFSVSHNTDSDKVYVCGENGAFAASNDGGASWNERITLMLSGSYNSIDAWKGGVGIDEVVLAGTGGSVLTSPDTGITQNYYLTKSGNLTIYINGKEPKQVRTNDGPFTWQPNGDLFFGDFKFGGTKTVNAILDEIIMYRVIPNGSINKRRVELTKQFDNVQKLVQTIAKKRIEFGSISPLSKSRSHWSQFNIFTCGAKEPIRHFQWTAQLGVQDDIIRDLAIDTRGFLWAATENGLCQFDINEANDDIERWINGLFSKPNGPKKFQNYNGPANGFESNSVNCVMVDMDGDIWAGTDKGLLFLSKEETSTISTKDPIAQEKENALTGASTNTVDNSFAGGDVVNKADVKWTKIENIVSDKILSLASDLTGTIVVGTDSGISVIKKEASTSTNTSSSMTTTNYGIADGLVSNVIQTITYDRKTKEFWIGTDKGISRFDKISNFNSLTTSNGLVSNNVFSIAVKDNKKYVGTDTGITVFEGNYNYSFLPSSGIGYGSIQDSDVDDYGSIWLATSSGLIQLDEVCGNRFVIYDYNDGIVGDPNIVPYQRYRILGGSVPKGSCDKALVIVSVNNNRIISGYTYNPDGPFIVFDEPKSASDKIEACINPGWRKIKCFNTNDFGGPQLATIETERLSFNIYRKVFSAGTVTLGGNHSDGSDTNSSMYFVLASPLTGTGNVIISSSPASTEIREDIDKESVVYTNIDEKITIVPTSLRLMQYIATSTNDENNQSNNDYLSFELSSDAMVYVAYDAKATSLPGWLREWTPVQAIYRIVDMDVYTDASGVKKLFVALAGTNGCVYEVLDDAEACNISDSIALDSSAPDGCATITKINSPTSVTLSLTAQDAVTGVSDMQVSTRSDFSDASWVPFAKNYILSIPPASMTDVTEVITTDTITTLPTGATFTVFHMWNGKLIVGTSKGTGLLPCGRVYEIDQSTLEVTLLFDTGEDTITSLATFGKYLLVGTGTNGRSFTWDGTTLLQIILPGGERISSIAVFNSRAYFGTFPEGKIYEMDVDLNVTLFMDTYENSVNGFAVFDSKLFWVTSNQEIAYPEILTTTTTKAHRHSIAVPSGTTTLKNMMGTTNVVDEHSHSIIDGIVQVTNNHTHYLNGSRSGKVFRYDSTSGDTIIIHSDKDYAITSIVSDTISNSGLMFVGTYPNGKILRYISSESLFIKSFDTSAALISSLKVMNKNIFAAADEDVFMFDGRRWLFTASTGGGVTTDMIQIGDSILMIVGNKIIRTSVTQATQSPAERSICAFVRFRDGAGNVTKIVDDDGKVIKCYNPCTLDNSGSTTTVTTTTTTTGSETTTVEGTTTGGTAASKLPPIVHRLTEFDDNAYVMDIFNGSESFFSGNKVTEDIGIYESEVFNGTTSLVQWVSLSWFGNAPTGTSITVAVRSGKTKSQLLEAEWSNEFTSATANDITNQMGQYLQFRATLKVSQPGLQSPELYKVDIQLRTSQAVHFFTTNFALPDNIKRGILTYNGCVNPPVTDIVFGICGLDSVDFSDYYPIVPNKVFELPSEQQRKNLRVGIKLISSPQSVPVVDEFALLFSLANDAIIRLNLPNMPGETFPQEISTDTRTVTTETVQCHSHTISFSVSITDKTAISGTTSINAGHSHTVTNGVVQISAGHSHGFEI